MKEAYIIIVISMILSAIIVILAKLYRISAKGGKEEADLLKKRNEELSTEKTVAEEKSQWLSKQVEQLTEEVRTRDQRITELTGEVNRKDADLINLLQRLSEQKQEIEEIQNKLRTDFENLANRIFEEKSQKFTDQNRMRLEEILKPLGEKLKDFEKKVDETYDRESKQRFSLEKEIRNLAELNMKISEDAKNLTTALRSDVKKQGNWGELVLERVLESSGLVKGQEYIREFVTKSGEGDIYRPDVIVNLPDNKHIIIDAKVSLVAYNDFVNAETQEDKDKFLKLHLLSLRNHVKILGEKNYSGLLAFDTPDYVLLFVPIESSFSLAIQNDVELFSYAWERNVVIVSPTTLLATLRTVASIWKHEKQELNAQEIARMSGDLYDKFVGFLTDLQEIGAKIDSAKKSYDQSLNKLSTGKGNLISRAEKIREMGARTSKQLPKPFLDKSEEDQ